MQGRFRSNIFYSRSEYLPDFQNKIFGAGHLIFHEIDIKVEVLMIELVGHFSANEVAELFEINDESRFRIGISLDGNNQIIIVSMPVFVSTRSKYLLVFSLLQAGFDSLCAALKCSFRETCIIGDDSD